MKRFKLANLSDSRFYSDTLVHFRNYLTGDVASKALGFISLPVMTRILSTDDYGTYSVYLSYVGIMTIVLTLNSHASVGRYIYEEKDDFNVFLGTVIISTAFLLTCGIIAFFLFQQRLRVLFSLPIALIALMPLSIINGTTESLFQQIFQAFRQSKKIAVVSMIKSYSIFGAGVVLALALSHDKYMGLILAQILLGCLFSYYFFFQIKPYLKWSFHKEHVTHILTYAIPLIPYMLSGVILDQFDRIMINSYRGSSDAGLYSLAYNIGMMLNIVSAALYQAWMPDYFSYMNKREYASIDSNVDKMFRLIVIAAAFLIFFGQDMGRVLASSRFHPALHIVPIIVAGYLFNAIFSIYAWNMGYAYKTFLNSLIVLSCGVLNIILNVIFIPKFGYEAAAYTTTASFFFMALFAWGANKFVVRLHTTPVSILTTPLMVLISFAGIFVLAQWHVQSGLGLFVIKILLMSGVVYMITRKYIPLLRPAE